MQNFPCDNCKWHDDCIWSSKYQCETLKQHRKNNPLSVRGRPTLIVLAEENNKAERLQLQYTKKEKI